MALSNQNYLVHSERIMNMCINLMLCSLDFAQKLVDNITLSLDSIPRDSTI